MNIIFDYGNVLVRWEPERVFLPFFGSRERYDYFWEHVCDRDFRDRIDSGMDMTQCVAEQQRRFPDYAEALALYQSHWDDALVHEMEGMQTLVGELKAMPNIHIYGLTNWSSETFPTARGRFRVLQMVEDYVVSGDVGMVKPDPHIYRLLLDKYRLDAGDCLFIDDNPNNVAGAESVGIRAIRFEGCDKLRSTLRGMGLEV